MTARSLFARAQNSAASISFDGPFWKGCPVQKTIECKTFRNAEGYHVCEAYSAQWAFFSELMCERFDELVRARERKKAVQHHQDWGADLSGPVAREM